MSAILDILYEMKPHPAMYIGSLSVTKLSFFLRGYEAALLRIAPDEHDRFLGEFRDYVQGRYGTSKKPWEQLLIDQAGDEAAGLELFWRLLDEFEKAHPESTINPGRVSLAPPWHYSHNVVPWRSLQDSTIVTRESTTGSHQSTPRGSELIKKLLAEESAKKSALKSDPNKMQSDSTIIIIVERSGQIFKCDIFGHFSDNSEYILERLPQVESEDILPPGITKPR